MFFRDIQDSINRYLNLLPNHVEAILLGSAIVLGSILAGLLIKWIGFKLLKLYNRRADSFLVTSIIKHENKPLGYFFPLFVLAFTLPFTPLLPTAFEVFRRIVEALLIISFAWVLINTVYIVEDAILHNYQITKENNVKERKMITQIQFMKRLVIIAIVVFAVSMVLISFETVRRLGTGILTSAGILGIIVGFAAQRSIANLLAGMQLAFTQPLRIDDVLVVEGEFGRVEEITMTYVVMRLWDSRRLVLPINYFIEKPFQNWTRTTADLLGTVFFHADYSLPVEEVRAELKRLLETTDLWDGKVWALQVTEARERTIEVRALMSAANSSRAFDLRCLVREKLIAFIQKTYPDSLPKTRAHIS